MSKKIFEIQKIVISALLLVVISISATGMMFAASNASDDTLTLSSTSQDDKSVQTKDEAGDNSRLERISELLKRLQNKNNIKVKYVGGEQANDLAESFKKVIETAGSYASDKTSESRSTFRHELKQYAEKYAKIQQGLE